MARAVLPLMLLLSLSLSRADVERAVSLARWPHTDAERAHFHDPYFVFTATDGLGQARTMVVEVEVVTEFRRVELLAEEHERLNDNFGRGGTDGVFQALRPWRGKVAVDVHLQLPFQTSQLPESSAQTIPIPPTEIEVSGVGKLPARQVFRTVATARSGFSPQWLQGNIVEALFDTAAVGRTTRDVRVTVDGHELVRVAANFATLE